MSLGNDGEEASGDRVRGRTGIVDQSVLAERSTQPINVPSTVWHCPAESRYEVLGNIANRTMAV
jgi:hypothetical protein